MDLWRILVLGVLKQGLDCDFDGLHELANQHRTVRAMLLVPASLSATWSVVAVDTRTGQVVPGALRWIPGPGLMDIQAIVVPGVGVGAVAPGTRATATEQRRWR